MKTPILRTIRALVLLTAAASLPACFAIPTKKEVARATPAAAMAESPIVEAYMEYVGPPERWAGPQTLVVHLTAKDPEFAQLTVNPPIAEAGALLAPLSNSSLAGPRRPLLDGANRLSYGVAKDNLSFLASSVKESPDPQFTGCLYPLRLKLVRSNGAVIERNGCRSLQGWPVVFSDVTSRVLTASMHPASDLPVNRAVASH